MANNSVARQRATPAELEQAVRHLLNTSKQPILEEPGEEPFPLTEGQFDIEVKPNHLVLTVWDEVRTLSRRAVDIVDQRAGRLKLAIEKFGGKPGFITLYDQARPSNMELPRHGRRLIFREQLRLMMRRELAGWRLESLSAEMDLEHSLSPKFPRALLRQGKQAWAVIACPPDSLDPDEVLTYGLLWLDYLRRRDRQLVIHGLTLFLPRENAAVVAARLRWLDTTVAQYRLFVFAPDFSAQLADPADWGNISSQLNVCRRPLEETQTATSDLVERILALDGVEGVEPGNGLLSLRVAGLEFGIFAGGQLDFGINGKQPVTNHHWHEIEATVAELCRMRSATADDRQNPIYQRQPERWLEAQVRRHVARLEPWLYSNPIYGQVPTFTARDRGIIDLLAVDRAGRLTVIELKASADPHLPLQALDYWMRVQHHASLGEFSGLGFFPGIVLRAQAPKLLLIAPALEFHPSTETLLRFYASTVEVERIGVGLEWRHRLQVLFRLAGAQSATSFAETT